jgi:hypothetical protein
VTNSRKLIEGAGSLAKIETMSNSLALGYGIVETAMACHGLLAGGEYRDYLGGRGYSLPPTGLLTKI